MERRGPQVTDADLRRFEQHIGADLPGDYRQFLLEINGGRTAETHCTFTMQRGARHVATSLNLLFSLDDPDQARDLASWQLYGEDRLPEGLEIGADDGGSPIVLVLSGPRRGEVWMLDRVDPRPTGSNPRADWFDRRDVWKLADSFAEFMASLRPLATASLPGEIEHVMDNNALDVAATQAIRAFAANVTVLVNPQGRPDRLGSGVLMYRDPSAPFIITASHVVEGDALPVNIGVSALGTEARIRNAVASIHRAPLWNGQAVDVAALILTDEAKLKLHSLGAPWSVFPARLDVSNDDYIVLTGSPTGLMIPGAEMRPDKTGRHQLDVDVVQLMYVTSYKGRDKDGHLCVEWGDAIVSGAATTANRPGWMPDKQVDLGSPVGISGAGLWRFPKAKSGELWSPQGFGQLLGIAVSWNKIDTQYCDPSDRFREWLSALI